MENIIINNMKHFYILILYNGNFYNNNIIWYDKYIILYYLVKILT